MTRIKRSPDCPKIIAMEITSAGRKGRRDVEVLTEDNCKFRGVYNKTLAVMTEEYKAKKLTK